jgi:hypothetical protein
MSTKEKFCLKRKKKTIVWSQFLVLAITSAYELG